MPQHPDRVLPLQGASNFRDLGGYPGHGGRIVLWRRLFRSDHLAGLTPADHALLAELGLARALDFRGEHERAATPYQLPGVAQHSLAIEPSVMQRMQALLQAGQPLGAAEGVALMQDLYRSMVNERARAFALLFEQLLDCDAPLVFHCTAGKDRTGWAAALVLLALGVPRAIVLQDYLMTNQVFKQPPLPADGTPAEALAAMWRVQEDYLAAALDLMDAEHGGIEPYLRGRLGLSPAALDTLAARYLQPV